MYRLIKTNETSQFFFYNQKDLPVVPGNAYVLEAELRLAEGSTNCFLQINFPGGVRTPYPISNSLIIPGEWSKLSLTFKTQPDETRLRMHVVMVKDKAGNRFIGGY